MEFPELLRMGRTVLLDSNVLSRDDDSNDSLLSLVKEVRLAEDLPLEGILQARQKVVSLITGVASCQNTYSILEVCMEMFRLRDGVNYKLRELKQSTQTFHRQKKTHCTPLFREGFYDSFNEPVNPASQERLGNLNSLVLDLDDFIRLLESRDVSVLFTPKEREDYPRFVNYFHSLGKKGLKRISSLTKKPLCVSSRDIHTDEKLAAAALVLAQRGEHPMIVSLDGDLLRLINGYRRDYNPNIPWARELEGSISVYSCFNNGRGFELWGFAGKHRTPTQ